MLRMVLGDGVTALTLIAPQVPGLTPIQELLSRILIIRKFLWLIIHCELIGIWDPLTVVSLSRMPDQLPLDLHCHRKEEHEIVSVIRGTCFYLSNP